MRMPGAHHLGRIALVLATHHALRVRAQPSALRRRERPAADVGASYGDLGEASLCVSMIMS